MKQRVCYLYEYEGSSRIRNVGFVKFMMEEDKAVFQIHGKGLACEKGTSLDFHLFSSVNGACETEFLGTVEGENGTVHYMMAVENLNDDNVDSYDGIFLRAKKGKSYAALWKNADVDFSVIKSKDLLLSEEDLVSDIEDEEIEQVQEEAKDEEICEEEFLEVAECLDMDENPEENADRIVYEKVGREHLSRLPQKERKLVNNSFLLHGYYNYKHLLFIKDGDSFFLGVPGVYYPREAEAARNFGFPIFHRVKNNEVELEAAQCNEGRDFGYWCRCIDM